MIPNIKIAKLINPLQLIYSSISSDVILDA